MTGNLSDLLSLLVRNVCCLLDVVVNDLLVGLVNQGREEEDGSGDE